MIDLSSIPVEHHNYDDICEAVAKSKLKNVQYFCFPNWFMESIDYSSETYFKLRSKNLRASIKKNVRNAKNKGNLEFIMVRNLDAIDEYINQYRAVYSKSWKERKGLVMNILLNG